MVYNKDNKELETTSTPPSDILKIMILQRRDDALSAIESYYKYMYSGATPPSHIVRSRVGSLFFDLEPCLRRSLSAGDYKHLSDYIFSDKAAIVILGFRELNAVLDQLKITRLDNNPRIDTTIVENENSIKGL